MLCFDPYTTGCQLSFRLLAKQWLDPKFAPNEATVAAVLAPYPSELMEAHDVSPLLTSQSMTGLTALTRLWSDSSGLFRGRDLDALL